jgi:hypothetical protein
MVSCDWDDCDNCWPEYEFTCGSCGLKQMRRFSHSEYGILECYDCDHNLLEDDD